jgi:hypothetical protein
MTHTVLSELKSSPIKTSFRANALNLSANSYHQTTEVNLSELKKSSFQNDLHCYFP